MQRALILLLIFATCSWANTGGKSPLIHTLKSGAQLMLTDTPVEKVRTERPRNPLDQGGDDCFSPTVISTLPYCDSGTTAGYNNDYFEECPQTQTAPDVVYEFVPLSDVTISISLFGSSYDTHLQVYETDTDCNNYWYYACDGDQGGQQSCIMGLTVYSGYTYYIIVDGENGGFGDYILNVVDGFDCPSAPCDNSGDTCENPLAINSLPYCDTRNTLAYNDDYFPECNSVACGERDVVYEYVPTSDLFLGISVASTEFQPHVEIWESGTDCSNSYLLGCATIHENGNSCITGVDVYAGYRYYIYVDGHECGGDGIYTLNVYEGGGCSYTACSGGNGDNCATAIQVTSLPFNYSGTTDGLNNDYNFCAYEDGAPDIVFSYSPTTTHLADILTCGNTQFESSLYIFRDGDLVNPFSNCTPRSCYTTFGGFWFNAALYCFEFQVGHDYCIVVDGTSANSFGPFVLDIYETAVEACNVGDICPLPDTETEPNSSCNPLQFDPDTLVFGDEVAGTICDPGDRDFYWVITPEDQWNIIGVQAGPNCDISGADLGISFVYPNGCYFTDPCNSCSWISGCGPETVAVMIAGLGDCYTGPYRVLVDSITAPYDQCDPVACVTAPLLECNVPTLVNTCDGCSSPICQTYRNGCGDGDRAGTGPQKFYRIDVPSTGDYTINVAAVDTTQDTQFSIFTDCVLPKTTCVFSQDQNYWAQNPTGPRWTETGTVSLAAGTYYLHVSQANSTCGDINVLVSCEVAPCLPPDSVTINWTTASTAEIRFISDGGTYEIYSTNIPNNDGDPRGGDPQWTLRHTANFSAGPSLWTDSDVTSAYRNYVIVKVCP